MLTEMQKHVDGVTNKEQIMYELATCICAAVDADIPNLYIVETEGEIKKFFPEADQSSP